MLSLTNVLGYGLVDGKSKKVETLFFMPRGVMKIYALKLIIIMSIAGILMVNNSFCVKPINLKLLYLHSTWPSSSNQLNAWMLFGLSISAMTL